jgi:hypothetical protein
MRYYPLAGIVPVRQLKTYRLRHADLEDTINGRARYLSLGNADWPLLP